MRPDTLAFVAAAFTLAITPGPDLALVTRHGLRTGAAGALRTSAGTLSGILVHAALAAVGLSALLASSATAFSVVKLAGAAYLVVLGGRALHDAVRGGHEEDEHPPRYTGSPFLQGFLTNVLNPKVALFFLTFLPQFVRPSDAVLARTLALSGLFLAVGAVVLLVYSLLIGRLAGNLARSRVRRLIDGATGVLFLGVGAKLAFDRSL